MSNKETNRPRVALDFGQSENGEVFPTIRHQNLPPTICRKLLYVRHLDRSLYFLIRTNAFILSFRPLYSALVNRGYINANIGS